MYYDSPVIKIEQNKHFMPSEHDTLAKLLLNMTSYHEHTFKYVSSVDVEQFQNTYCFMI